ncbi:Replication protein A 70 kDa DNA-binding subunit A [Bienertia sinuspersici]
MTKVDLYLEYIFDCNTLMVGMSSTYNYIAEIDISKKNLSIVVRITRRWEVKYNTASDTADSLDMVLLDEQGSQIQATIKKELINHFKEATEEGCIYKISHFNIGKNRRTHRRVENDSIIWFTSFTTILWQEEGIYSIPKHKFNFHPLDQLSDRSNRVDILTEIIGQLTAVENKIEGTITYDQRRTIYIKDHRDVKIKATLWGEKADIITNLTAQNDDVPQIVIITAAKVTMFNGKNYIYCPIM